MSTSPPMSASSGATFLSWGVGCVSTSNGQRQIIDRTCERPCNGQRTVAIDLAGERGRCALQTTPRHASASIHRRRKTPQEDESSRAGHCPGTARSCPLPVQSAHPPLEPAGVRLTSHGLLVLPKMGLSVCMSIARVGSVGPADDDCASLFQELDRHRIGIGYVVLEWQVTRRGARAPDAIGVLDRDRNPMQWAAWFARGPGTICLVGLSKRLCLVERHDGVVGGVVFLDLRKVSLGSLRERSLRPRGAWWPVGWRK